MYNPQPSLFLSFPKFIYLCVWVFWLPVCLCTTCAPCASGGQRRQQIPWNCGYGQLWTDVWVLGIEPVLLATKPSVQLRFSFFHLSATHRRVYWDQGILPLHRACWVSVKLGYCWMRAVAAACSVLLFPSLCPHGSTLSMCPCPVSALETRDSSSKLWLLFDRRISATNSGRPLSSLHVF